MSRWKCNSHGNIWARAAGSFSSPRCGRRCEADTCAPRCGTPVRATIKAFAGVSNVGSYRHWTANQFDQANWYAFGRLAWNPAASPSSIAEEWTRMTWGNDSRLVRPVVQIMARSREAAVDYMTPLGLAHQMATDHHYGPGPWVCDLAERVGSLLLQPRRCERHRIRSNCVRKQCRCAICAERGGLLYQHEMRARRRSPVVPPRPLDTPNEVRPKPLG
jgi:hypothetical protein